MRSMDRETAQPADFQVVFGAVRILMLILPLLAAFGSFQALRAETGASSDAGAAPAVTGPSEASGQDMYKRGFYEEALAEWKKAVEQHQDAGAAFRLAEEYFDAKVVKRDIPQSIHYLKIGAEGGDHRAQMDLGSRYDDGIGVEQDVALAAQWFEKSAQQGNAAAQYNIGTMYQDGSGVPKDLEKAYMYYLLAIENGFPPLATTQIDQITPDMTPDQIKRATLMAREVTEARKSAN